MPARTAAGAQSAVSWPEYLGSGFGFGGRPKKGLILSADLGLLSTSGAKVTGPDPMIANEIADDAFFGSILPNIQFGIAWGF